MIITSIILPTYNEKENIPVIIEKIEKVLAAGSFEIVIVDDNSPDGTYETARKIAQQKPHIQAIKRIHEKGLSSAVIHGFSAARGKYFIVMDADMQHDETVLGIFVKKFDNGADVIVGTRKADGGGIENWSASRRFISWGATMLAKITLRQTTSDPMSGFFGITRQLFDRIADKMNPRGFKILLEVLHHANNAKIEEIGYVFKPRQFGESKLSGSVMVSYLVGLYELRFGKLLPLRFIKYSLVGLSGVAVNQGFLWAGKSLLGYTDDYALIIGIEASILSNFLLNNYFTFRDVRITGALNLLKGLIWFNIICLAGAFINYGTALLLTEKLGMNIYLTNLIGIALATAWNYLINIQVTWRQRRQ